ncbi:MAG: SulP family inorganic anion transporter [Rhodospirillales bacterium]|nr:SulP family inorganic anion transporter [Rhodospirillales bacterium]
MSSGARDVRRLWRGLLAWPLHDLLAGLLLAATAVPSQLATARLAGLAPESGLIAFVAASVGFAVFGASRYLAAGADSTIAPIFAGSLAALAVTGSAEYAHLAMLLALMVGAILVAAALLHAGWIADLLSIPATTGFLAGVAVHIVVGQLPTLLGVPEVSGPVLQRLPALLAEASAANPSALAIGLVAIVATLLTERLAPHVPGALLAILAGAAAVAVFHLQAAGVAMLAGLPSGLPHPRLPAIGGTHDIVRLAPLAGIIALVCMMQTATVVRAFAGEGEELAPVSPNFAGIGVGCLLSGLSGAFAVNASPSLTSAMVEAGGRSQRAPLIAAGGVALLLLFGGALFAWVPQAALAGVLIAIAIRIFRLREMLRILRFGGSEILIVLASAALVIVLPIETGMLASIALSLLQSFYAVARPLCVELARAPGTTVWWPPIQDEASEHEPGVLVFAPAAPLNFTNAVFVCRRLAAAVAAARDPVRLLVIEASGIVSIDYTGARILQETIAELRARGIAVALARLSAERAQRQAEQTGLLASVGAARVFRSVEDAVRATRRGNAAIGAVRPD